MKHENNWLASIAVDLDIKILVSPTAKFLLVFINKCRQLSMPDKKIFEGYLAGTVCFLK